jgi:hypothetical protein
MPTFDSLFPDLLINDVDSKSVLLSLLPPASVLTVVRPGVDPIAMLLVIVMLACEDSTIRPLV